MQIYTKYKSNEIKNVYKMEIKWNTNPCKI